MRFLTAHIIHTLKKTNSEIKTNRKTFSLVSDADVEEAMLFM